MIKFFKSLFSESPNEAFGIVGDVTEFVDEAFHTDQEKSEANMERFKLWIAYQKATQGQNKARRLIALSTLFTFLFTFFLVLIVGSVAFLFQLNATPWFEFVKELVITWRLAEATFLVFSFYYVKGYLGK